MSAFFHKLRPSLTSVEQDCGPDHATDAALDEKYFDHQSMLGGSAVRRFGAPPYRERTELP
jgi:hypothetical protein